MIETIAFRKIGIIGTGRVARALGSLLASHSAEPVQVWSRTASHRSAMVQELGSAEAAKQISDIVEQCDLILIAVTDDALTEIVAQLEASLPKELSAFIFHVSGRSGTSLFGVLEGRGALTAAIHPVMTFTGDAKSDIRNLRGAYFGITASKPLAAVKAREIVDLVGGKAFEIAEGDRPLYHAALSHVANHLVTLVTQSSRMLEAANIRDPRAIFASLVRAALENSIEKGFAALSGPLLRGDQETIKGHLSALIVSCPELVPAYRALALATLEELEQEGQSVAPELRRELS